MTSEDQPGGSREPAEQSAKSRTIQQLNEFEAKKAEAKKSLDEKLSAFGASLPEDERALLQGLLAPAQPAASAEATVVSVHLKPMQVHEGPEVAVFLKPMQVHPGPEVSVFLKPMQVHEGAEAYLKPMQVHEEEEAVYLKPMQRQEE